MTDTPRTDAIEFRHCPPQPKELLKKHQDAYALSRELERELAASQAEVERLKSDKTHLITQCANLLEKPHFDEREVHCSCVPALREEVARLREAYLKSIERDDFLTQEVDRLKAQLTFGLTPDKTNQ
jgi:uncharacterized small protein (DUF1192 family)